MTRKEFAPLVKGMKAVYTYDGFIKDKDAFDVWYELLKDLSYEQCSTAVHKFMSSETKLPTPADIRRIASEIINFDTLSELEAWAMVKRACEQLDWTRPEVEFNKLPEVVRRAAVSPNNLVEWASSDVADFETVIGSNFMRTFKAISKSYKEEQQLSPEVRQRINGLRWNKAIEEKNEYITKLNDRARRQIHGAIEQSQ